jgi:hypothetical protein
LLEEKIEEINLPVDEIKSYQQELEEQIKEKEDELIKYRNKI